MTVCEMDSPKIRVVNGINYPRDVACPEGFPPGWKGVEQIFREGTNMAGKKYVGWHNTNGKHKDVPKTKKM